MKKRYEILIKGNVQRVGFRNHAAQIADTLNISGSATYVDHDILIEAEGYHEQLQTFVNWCRKGPEGASIDSFEIVETVLQNDLKFVIVHGLVISNEDIAV